MSLEPLFRRWQGGGNDWPDDRPRIVVLDAETNEREVCPDVATIDVFNTAATNPDILATWPPAFRAGIRQADDLAEQLIDAGWP
ncbi:hypothetical protein ACWELJ_19325 [Nocardia sp. NPDC004582]